MNKSSKYPICKIKMDNPKKSRCKISEWMKEAFNIMHVQGQADSSDIFQNESKYITITDHKPDLRRIRKAMLAELEKAFAPYVVDMANVS